MKCKDNQVLVNDCELVDIGYAGPYFMQKRGGIHERLDRSLCNLERKLKYEKATVYHLPHVCSYHRPILISPGVL